MKLSKTDKIKYVTWMDPEKTMIRVNFTESKNDYIVGSDVKEDPILRQVMKQFTLADIDKMTEDYRKFEADREILFNEFYENYREWARWREVHQGNLTETVDWRETLLLRTILDIAENKEKFFKLKLEVFELKAIRHHKDRKLKSALRKSQTVPELLALIHQAGIDLKSELAEHEDKIPVQDVTNQTDTQDSEQSPIDAASDVPIESSNQSE